MRVAFAEAEVAEVAEAAEAGLRLPVLPVEIPLGLLRRLHGWCAAHREPLLADEATVAAHGEAHALLDGMPHRARTPDQQSAGSSATHACASCPGQVPNGQGCWPSCCLRSACSPRC